MKMSLCRRLPRKAVHTAICSISQPCFAVNAKARRMWPTRAVGTQVSAYLSWPLYRVIFLWGSRLTLKT